MALERRNPVPVGRYWVDVQEKDNSTWHDWLMLHKDVVIVLKSEPYSDNATWWYLFEVNQPVEWKGPGFPTIDEGAQSIDDTGTKIPTYGEELSKELDDIVDKAGTGIAMIGAVLAAGVIGYVLLKRK